MLATHNAEEVGVEAEDEKVLDVEEVHVVDPVEDSSPVLEVGGGDDDVFAVCPRRVSLQARCSGCQAVKRLGGQTDVFESPKHGRDGSLLSCL